MIDLIRRSDSIRELDSYRYTVPEIGYVYPIITGVVEFVERMPTVDAAYVVHGKWIEEKLPMRRSGYIRVTCSVCGRSPGNSHTAFCPYCGAKMDGEA